MSVSVILRGFMAGALAAALIAFILALIDFNTVLSSGIVSVALWTGTLMVSAISGWVAGRGADQAGWIHGMLASLTVFLVGKVIAENLHMGAGNHLWIGMAVSMIVGMIGGMWGANTQY
ncbi:TIGR04086 family membrane protein [Sulfobacillus thermosulfidooxidans]|uniref:TIGR04086 family membrane protein n=1 Tax=Sulfobacillus thermosulfidooxidans TaxID=28034 RepID=UPI0006B5C4E3|nr:TIGR04086 family membrane protein [Sulfobacillus thermosulfidooxidans]